eukprot:30869-Pelagococcus_subviridis.AAC.2
MKGRRARRPTTFISRSNTLEFALLCTHPHARAPREGVARKAPWRTSPWRPGWREGRTGPSEWSASSPAPAPAASSRRAPPDVYVSP